MAGTSGPGAVKPLRDWNAADEAASGKSCLLSMSPVLVPHPVATRGSIGCEGYTGNSRGGDVRWMGIRERQVPGWELGDLRFSVKCWSNISQ